MFSDWFSFVMRASLLLLISGICVAMLSRFYPLASPRWHRLAWGAVLLQGIVLVPISLTIQTPEWLAASWFHVSRDSKSEQELIQTEKLASPAAAMDSPLVIKSPAGDSLIADSMENPAAVEFGTGSQRNLSSHTILTAENTASLAQSTLAHPVAETRETVSTRHHLHSSSTEASSSATGDLTSAGSPSESVIRWADLLALVWIVGVLGIVGFGLVNYIMLNFALLKARPARRSWAKELQDLSLELHLDRSVALDVHPVIGPLICWTPVGHQIVVPVGLWSELSSDERLAVLHHELSHLRRGDLWKSLLARMILALHWFNPVAWISARRFDESAEWACDALMAGERPARVTQLANALLAATTARDGSPILALSATGGPLFQRVRRLVSWDQKGDTVMQRFVWGGLLCPLVCLGLFQLQFTAPLAAQSEISSTSKDTSSSPEDESANKTTTAVSTVEDDKELERESIELKEIADRIIVGDQENLKKFVELLKTPTGQIIIADRAAMQAQDAVSEQDDASQWQQFVNDHFQAVGSTVSVNADFQSQCDAYVQDVNVAEADVLLIGPVLKEIAAAMDTSTEPAQFLQRFLNHEGAPAFVFDQELRSRLHPRIEDLSEVFSELLVRNRDGQFVIRPARRNAVEARLKNIERLQPMLKRFEEELAAWSKDLANPDKRHGNLKAMLADPGFAAFLASRNLMEDDEPDDEHFDDNFYWLEEATNDAPAGLILNVESDQLKEIESEMSRFTAIRDERSVLEQPLKELIDRLVQSDDLHVRFRKYLSSDLALMIVVREMDYSPISADDAAREWLGYLVTKGDNGKYTITSESPEDVKSRYEDFFREFREVRRRGRTIDEFASKLSDKKLGAAIRTLSGKLILDSLVESSARRPDVDGLALWFESYFEETSEGLRLKDWAGEQIDELLRNAAELDEELSKTDF